MIVNEFCAGPWQARAYLVEDRTAGEALVIDPGQETDALLAEIARRFLRVTAIVNTHGHFDHVSGNRSLRAATGAPLLIHRADARLATQAAAIAALVGRHGVDSPEPDGPLEEGLELRVGRLRFVVRETPGHTPGSISLLGPAAVFCGDLVVHGAPGRTGLAGCDEILLERSITHCLGALPPETTVYAGHDPQAALGALLPGLAVAQRA